MRKKLLSLIFFIISFLSLESQTVLTYEGQTYNNTTTSNWSGIDIPRSVLTTFTFRNNSVTSVNVQGYMLQAGDEGVAPTNGNLNGELITGNRFNWNGNFDGLLPNMVITHGVFTGCNINVNIRYNYLSRVPMGIIRKSGNSMTNTSGGVSYNILKTFNVGGVVKGMNNVNWYNNTFYNDRSRSQTWRPCIEIYENTDVTPTALARGTKIKNNIFYTKYKTYAIGITTDSRNGFECDYNVYWCEEGDHMPVFSVNGSELTWTQWKALGYDAHSVVINPNFIDFTNFVPTTRLDYGTDLGTSFNTGLSTSATWTVGSSPTTQIQNGTWQVGARIYSPTTPSTTARYVATNGNDGNPGTIDLPWKTWQKGFSSATPGDTVYIRGGVYYPSATNFNIWYNANAGVYINGKNGTSTSKIVVQNYPNETPILDCSSITNPTYRFGVVLAYCNYWTIKGLTVRNTAQYDEGTGGSGFWFFSVNNCLFERLVSYDNGGSGITLLSSSDQNTILNCDAYNNYDQYSGGFNADGIEVSFITDRTPKRTNYIKGCRSWNNSDDGYDHYAYNGFLFIENCWAWHNGYNKGGTTMTGDGNGFKLGKPEVVISTTTPYIVVKNCLAWDNKAGGYTLEDTYSSSNFVHIYNSVAYNNKCSWEAGFQGNVDGNSPNHVIRNNIAYANVTNYSGLTGTIDHNSWNGFSVSSSDFTSLDASGTSGNRQSNGDLPELTFLHLAQGSDLINAGINVGLPYNGSAPDIGAYEFIESTPITTFYVATNGINSSTRNGGVGQEWASLSYACTRAIPGSTIHVNAGTYYESSQCVVPVNVDINGEGESSKIISSFNNSQTRSKTSAYILFSGGSNTRQSISNIWLDGNSTTGYVAIAVIGRSNVSIHDCKITNFRWDGITFTGAQQTGNKLYNSIIDNSAESDVDGDMYEGTALYVSYNTGMEIYNNQIYSNKRATADLDGECMTVGSGVNGPKIYGNTFVRDRIGQKCNHWWYFAIEFWEDSHGPGSVHGLEFYNNTVIGELDFGSGLSKGTYPYSAYIHDNIFGSATAEGWEYRRSGIQFEINTRDVIVENNLFRNLSRDIYFCPQSGEDNTIERAYIYGNHHYNCKYAYDPQGAAIAITGSSSATYNTVNGIYVWNNTAVASSTNPNYRYLMLPTAAACRYVEVINNIVVGFSDAAIYAEYKATGGSLSYVTIQKNILYQNGNNNNLKLVNFTISNLINDGGIKQNPLLTSSTDFRLSSTSSPAYHAGNNISRPYGTDDYYGVMWNNPPSIGACEYFSSIVIPTVTTTSISNITVTTATSGGNVTNNGGGTITARGVCWSTSQNPTTANSKTTDGTGTGIFTSSIAGLTGNTIYYVRAYATNSAGTAYGNQISFESAHIPPTVSTAAITNITTTSAVSGGNVTLQGGENVTAKGVCWSTSSNPTIANSRTNDGTGLGSFVSNITGLSPSTTYHVRAYATNIIGTSYGSDIQFTTNNVPINPPTITTTNISNITSNSATGGGNITSDGGATVTARGVCWSTSQSPTITNSKTTDGSGTGSFTSSITGLSPNTTYYVRAYATNSSGTSYGTQTSFTTLINLPALTTTPITNITTTTATSGGNITSDGGGLITARGVCWSTSQNPTIVNSKTTDGTGSGTFTSSITGLSPNTTYYVRAYATNSMGTSYGEQVLFTTTVNLPSVTTTQITSITSITATGGGNVTSDGGSTVTVRGICWATTQNPTITNPKTTDGSGLGSFISSITGLSPNTTYYVRAYATNSVGTIYGSQVTFTTSINLPSLTTSSISNITTTTATGGGNITSDGGASVTAKGICWATTQNPTITNSKTTDGSGIGLFTSNMTGLSLNTTYYVRAYATNSAGTSYGNQVSFTTLSDLPTLTTSPISNITTTTATSGGNITSDGGSNVTARGICWATTQNPTIANSKTINGTGIGSFISNITGLSLNTTYYVRAYATNSVGTSYGNQISFNTLANLPTLTTNSITNITSTTASGGGNITSDGGSNVTARGICWSTTQNPTIVNTKTTDGIGTGSFVSLITGLSPNITYYVRAYATNSVGTSYGNQISFTTVANLPTLTTSSISNITPTTATGGGNITSDGGTTITVRGICWSISSNPTITSSKTIDGGGTGIFTSSMTGLVGNTVYYVRAYATNSVGTSYGNEISFKSGSLIPTISTVPAVDITYFGAVSGGNITSDGGENVTARGVCWSTLPNPTISNSYTNDGSGLGTFSSNISGLLPSTTYYVRAYATNIIGTAYGNSIQFTTSDKPNTYIVTNNGFRIVNDSYVITNTK